MCNDYEQHVAYKAYLALMQSLELNPRPGQSDLDLPQADDIKIGEAGPVMRALGDQVQLDQMRFGFPPKGKGGPVFNFKSEGRHFTRESRCLIPASAFFEYTGVKYPKAKHRFTLVDAPFLAIAGLWREGTGNQPAAFTMLTMAPGPDVAPIHNRQIAVLRPDSWRPWLEGGSESDLLEPLPAGSLAVETVRQGSD